ncbi:toll/interleukin-1 receptor domain-containing protein [Metabacillus indicus]|uniref:toll/interleukin-1 receptor domain-containing protein n=1 Tax=Metabacillus indicus TaxID=246786 RepID=UPI003CEB6CCE
MSISLNKVFISHSSNDEKFVKLIIKFLKEIGINSKNIYCSSLEGYGVPADGDILEWMKSGLTGDVLVLYVLSENFYNSPYCMCEMGATWVQTKTYIPILIPPFDYKNIQGVIPSSKKAYKINDNYGISSIKTTIEEKFGLTPINLNIWLDFIKEYELEIGQLIDNSIKDKLNGIPLELIEGKTFGVEQVYLDGNNFVNCIFEGSELVYKGEYGFGLESCKFRGIPRIKFADFAGTTLNVLKTFYNAGPEFREIILKTFEFEEI